MSSRVTGTLLREALAQSQKQIVYGEVSLSQPAPASFASPLYVTIPDWSIDFYHTVQPGNWFACHGSTLPQPGAHCLLIFDNQGTLTCPMWGSASTSFAPSGTAGGDLTGSFPNPSVATVLGGQTPLAVDGAGKSLALQLLSTQKLQLDLGVATLPTGTTNIPHGLGHDPTAVALTPFFAAGALTNPLRVSSLSSSAIGATNDNAATTSAFWIAIG